MRSIYACLPERSLNIQFDQALGQIRPILSLIGSVIIAAGLAKYFGLGVPISGSGLELAVAGFLLKHV